MAVMLRTVEAAASGVLIGFAELANQFFFSQIEDGVGVWTNKLQRRARDSFTTVQQTRQNDAKL